MNKIKTLLIILIAGFVNSANAAADELTEHEDQMMKVIPYTKSVQLTKMAVWDSSGKILVHLGFTNTKQLVEAAKNIGERGISTVTNVTLDAVVYQTYKPKITLDAITYGPYVTFGAITPTDPWNAMMLQKIGGLSAVIIKTNNHFVIGLGEASVDECSQAVLNVAKIMHNKGK